MRRPPQTLQAEEPLDVGCVVLAALQGGQHGQSGITAYRIIPIKRRSSFVGRALNRGSRLSGRGKTGSEPNKVGTAAVLSRVAA
jgi:hypothetical protein